MATWSVASGEKFNQARQVRWKNVYEHLAFKGDWMTKNEHAPRVWPFFLMLAVMFAASVACAVVDPAGWTPSPPQQTEAVYQATWAAGSRTPTPSPALPQASATSTPAATSMPAATSTPILTLTWSIIVVTDCGQSICEVNP